MTSISLIGPGGHGTAIAALFAAHGTDVTLYHRRPAQAELAASVVRAAASGGASVRSVASLTEAVDGQEVVLITTMWNGPQREVLSALEGHLDGKIVVDVSNPLDRTPHGIRRSHPVEGSSGQLFATFLPRGVGHVKAFSNLDTALIASGADHDPPAVLPFLADSNETARRIRPYLERTGWQPWYAGGIDRSPDMEVGGKFNNPPGRWGRSGLDSDEMFALDGPEHGSEGD